MNTHKVLATVILIAGVILVAGLAGGVSSMDQPTVLAAGDTGPHLVGEATVADTISYQGQLTSPSGTPLTGTYTMRFQLYNVASGGVALWDSGAFPVDVDRGLFNVKLDVPADAFTGQALWLRINVHGQWLTPRQELLPAPYALSLRPGAEISGEPTAWTGSVLRTHMEGSYPVASALKSTTATGYAVYGDSSGGYALRGYSDAGNALSASSNTKTAGVFHSNEGYGIRVNTNGTNHWDHAGYFTSNMGYGVYGVSSQNDGVRGEGDIAGVRGRGDVIGTYGYSSANFGLYGGTSSGFGVYGYTASGTNNYGLYTPDNLYANAYHLTGAMMQVAQNSSTEPLDAGDVVIFSGINTARKDMPPIVQVSTTTSLNSTAVAGVVHSRYDLDAVRTMEMPSEQFEQQNAALPDVTPPGSVAPGDYLLLVVHGPAQVKAEALDAGIQPGDLLATGTSGGHATKAVQYDVNGVATTAPGSVFGKALEPLEAGQNTIYAFVTLQ